MEISNLPIHGRDDNISDKEMTRVPFLSNSRSSALKFCLLIAHFTNAGLQEMLALEAPPGSVPADGVLALDTAKARARAGA